MSYLSGTTGVVYKTAEVVSPVILLLLVNPNFTRLVFNCLNFIRHGFMDL